ncbi:MAG: hypothetical protein HYY13_04615 [Nitrospirae bacterium]|nr:hypothetical protein [Nitrospirota bacterium]
MDDAAIRGLTRRLERVERQHLLLRRASASILVVVAVALLASQATSRPTALEAERLYIKDWKIVIWT